MLIIRVFRLHHWIKNFFLFIPVFFAGEIFNLEKLFQTSVGFIAFGFAASTIYILNDIKDIDEDRAHPRKSTRPLASGEVSVRTGYLALTFSGIMALSIAYFLSIGFAIVLLSYMLLNIGYSFGLKNRSILDILILASGFELRVIAGGIAAEVPITQWLMVMIFLLALFLAIAKRREDVSLDLSEGSVTRKSTSGYTLEYLNAILIFNASVMVVAYIMYCLTSEVAVSLKSNYLVVTTIFVLAGLMRYIQIALVENNAGSPTKIIYTDKFVIITVLAWMVTFFVILY
ncbi:MAG: decaprenyl-phosphate phosphoribosyltransferase [Cyclobacteriaceae bacterium]|nr:decaprenyl-phosphate phosphoribosyltransferase [Cyclobacteriaceae bacterium]